MATWASVLAILIGLSVGQVPGFHEGHTRDGRNLDVPVIAERYAFARLIASRMLAMGGPSRACESLQAHAWSMVPVRYRLRIPYSPSCGSIRKLFYGDAFSVIRPDAVDHRRV